MKKLFFTFVLILLLFGSCGKKQAEETPDMNFTAKNTALPYEYDAVISASGYENMLVFAGESYEDFTVNVELYDMNGGEQSSFAWKNDENCIYSLGINEDTVFMTVCEMSSSTNKLLFLNMEGSIKKEIEIDSYIGKLGDLANVTSKIICSDQYICLHYSGGGILLFDIEGNFLYAVKNEEMQDIGFGKDGYLYFTNYSDEKEPELRRYRLEEKKAAEEKVSESFETGLAWLLPAYSGSYLYSYTGDALYTLQSEKITQVLNWDSIGSINGSILCVVQNKDNTIRVFTFCSDLIDADTDEYESYYEIWELTPGSEETVDNRLKLTLAGKYEADFERKVAEFNRSQSKCYLEYNAYTGSPEEAARQFRIDVLSGKIPDILILNSADYQAFAEAGLLEDLSPYISAAGFDSEEYYTNVTAGMKYKTALIGIITGFELYTLTADKPISLPEGYSLSDMGDILDRENEYRLNFVSNTYTGVLETCLLNSGTDIIDFETKQLSVTKEQLVAYLEFAAKYGFENWKDYPFPEQPVSGLGIYSVNITSSNQVLNSYLLKQMETFGEEFTYIGYPETEGNGAVIYPVYALGMSAACENKEAAWDFIESFFTEEEQSRYLSNGYFSVNRELTESYMGKDIDGDAASEENGTYSTRQYQELMEVIAGAEEIKWLNEEINTIIYEEADAYFSGAKTAEETADLILERLQIYIDEK